MNSETSDSIESGEKGVKIKEVKVPNKEKRRSAQLLSKV